MGQLVVDVQWLHSRAELCTQIVNDLEKENKKVQVAFKESRKMLDVLHAPFPPIEGFEIAAKVSEERDLNADPVTFLEDPFRCNSLLIQVIICMALVSFGKK